MPDDLAVQRARKMGYNKGWNDGKLQDFDIIEDALRQGTNFTEFSQILREKITEPERNA